VIETYFKLTTPEFVGGGNS